MSTIHATQERLEVEGLIDIPGKDELIERLNEMHETRARDVTIDLERAESVDSTCIGAVIALWMDLNARGQHVHLVLSPRVKRVFDQTGLSAIVAGKVNVRG